VFLSHWKTNTRFQLTKTYISVSEFKEVLIITYRQDFRTQGNQEVKRLKLISDRISYIKLIGYWCDIVLNVHAPTEDKSNDTKDNFNRELDRQYILHPPNYKNTT
jgi:hypothetical protein